METESKERVGVLGRKERERGEYRESRRVVEKEEG